MTISIGNGLFQKISKHLLWTALTWVPTNFRICEMHSNILCKIPNPAGSKSWGISEFCKTFNGFSGILAKNSQTFGEIHEIPVSLTEHLTKGFPMSSMGGMWIFSGIAQCLLNLLKYSPGVGAIFPGGRTFAK